MPDQACGPRDATETEERNREFRSYRGGENRMVRLKCPVFDVPLPVADIRSHLNIRSGGGMRCTD